MFTFRSPKMAQFTDAFWAPVFTHLRPTKKR